ncbi:MAG: hypothetical protein AAF581_14480 [Planctomycetota bacterium]
MRRTCFWGTRLLALAAATMLLVFVHGRSHGFAQQAPIARLAAMLRDAPADEALLARVLDRLLQAGAVASCVELLTGDDADAAALHVAGRLLEESGQRAAAFTSYERANKRDDALPITRARLVRLYLDADWGMRAQQVWQQGIDAPWDDQVELQYRLLRAQQDAAASEFLKSADKVDPLRRATWAEREHDWATAAFLCHAAGAVGRTVELSLRSGAVDAAVAQWQAAPTADRRDAVAMLLSRVTGDSSFLLQHLGERQDDAAERLRQQLRASTEGVVGLPAGTQPRELPPGALNPSADNTGANNSGPNSAGAPHPTARPPSPADAILAGARDPQSLAAVEALPTPSLARAAALLALGKEARARREFTLWRIDGSDSSQQAWVGYLRTQAPTWFATAPPTPQYVVRAAESRVGAPRIVRRLDQALVTTEAGTALEAQLLFHRGRLLSAEHDLLRARRVAPQAAVGVRHDGFRCVEPIAQAVHRILGESAPLAQTQPTSDGSVAGLPTAPVGAVRGEPLLLGRFPHAVRVHEGPWFLSRWTDAPRAAAPAAPATGRATAVAPIHSHVTVPGLGTLRVGVGLVLERDDGGWMQLEATDSWELRTLPEAATSLLPKSCQSFLSALRPAAVPGWAGQEAFLAGATLRHPGATTQIVSTLHDDGKDTLLVCFSTGERAWLTRHAPTTTAQTFTGMRPESDGFFVDANAPVTAPAPPAPFSDRLVRSDHLRQSLASATAPAIDAVLRREARQRPPELEGVAVVARAGTDPLIEITSDGHVCCLGSTGSWIATIATPLPGAGALQTARIRNTVRADAPVPGPIADAATPLILLRDDGFLVLTNSVYRYSWSGPLSRVDLDATTRLRDATVANDTIWILGERNIYFADASNAHLRTFGATPLGAFDIEACGTTVFVLCHPRHSREKFRLLRSDQSAPWRDCAVPDLTWEGDRASLLLTRLAVWDDHLLLLHDHLYAAATRQSPLAWQTLVRWDDQDPFRFPIYWQTAPRVTARGVVVSRPWGVVELWSPPLSEKQ